MLVLPEPQQQVPLPAKGRGRCYAIEGDNRYHSIFGGSVEDGCCAVHPSDTAPALIALDAKIKTSNRTIDVEDFFDVKPNKTTVLDDDEIVTEIQMPAPRADPSAFPKFALRRSIDFPIVNCAAAIAIAGGRVSAARVCLNAVHVIPYRATEAEESIMGKAITDDNAELAGVAAVSAARPLPHNGYMVQIARVLVMRTILAADASRISRFPGPPFGLHADESTPFDSTQSIPQSSPRPVLPPRKV